MCAEMACCPEHCCDWDDCDCGDCEFCGKGGGEGGEGGEAEQEGGTAVGAGNGSTLGQADTTTARATIVAPPGGNSGVDDAGPDTPTKTRITDVQEDATAYVINGLESNIAAGSGLRIVRWLRHNELCT